ncbi:Retrotransposon gag domain [Sesbania bispinosa]|nr:Retrotransposon gag domain [Sesbania bispinosa]
MEDSSNPLFLHHSDGPGLMLVSQPLNDTNYNTWTRAMLVKNKTGFIDGSIPKPDGSDPALLNAWTRNNNLFISWIYNSISKEIIASIMYSPLASEIWQDLRDRFQQKNGPHIFQLRKDLMSLVQGHDSMNQYFTKLKVIWEEVSAFRPLCNCTCGGLHPMEEHCQMEYVMSFLMGLNDSFAQLHSYPPGFKPKYKVVSMSNSHTVSQVSECSPASSSVDASSAALTASQCQQLISMLSTQLANISPIQDSTGAQGQIMFDEDWQG